MKLKCLTLTCRFAAAALFTLSGVLSARGSDYPTTVLSFNPVAYYRLSESVSPPLPNIITNYGSLGAAENAFAYSGLNVLQAQPGFPGLGNSAQFLSTATANNTDYSSDIDAPYNAALNPNGPFTIEFWAKPHAMDADIYSPVCSMASPSRSGWLFYWDGTTASNQWQLRVGGPSSYCFELHSAELGGTGAGGTILVPTGAATDTWYYVVGEYDGTSAYLYVNGHLNTVQTNITPGRTFNPNSYNPFRIGATTIFGRNFNGWVQHVAMYGSALSANTVSRP